MARSVVVPGIASMERRIYTVGDCWMLAYYLHQQSPNLLPTFAGERGGWTHVAVGTTSHILDIHGWSTVDEWERRWQDDCAQEAAEPMTREQWREFVCYPWAWESKWWRTDEDHMRVAMHLSEIPVPCA
jgi:hypothetical protein